MNNNTTSPLYDLVRTKLKYRTKKYIGSSTIQILTDTITYVIDNCCVKNFPKIQDPFVVTFYTLLKQMQGPEHKQKLIAVKELLLQNIACCAEPIPPVINFSIQSSNWATITDETTFNSFLTSQGATGLIIESFSLIDGLLLASVQGNITSIDFTGITGISLVNTLSIPTLTYLDIRNNNLTTFNIAEDSLPNLETLYLENNNLTDFNPSFLTTNLQNLTLNGNNLPTSVINTVLIDLDELGLSAPLVADLSFQSPLAPPSGLGSTAKTNLQGRGATINTN